MGVKKRSIADLERDLDALNKERLLLLERIKLVMLERNRKIREENLDFWGLTEEEYESCKQLSRTSGTPAHVVLNRAREKKNKEAREAKTAYLEAMQTKTRVKGL